MFSRDTFTNGKLWAAVGGVVVLQVLAVRLGPAAAPVRHRAARHRAVALCFVVAVAIIWAEEIRKLIAKLVVRR